MALALAISRSLKPGSDPTWAQRKFFNIQVPLAGLTPSAVVVVAQCGR
jgi:formyltetrahydrofolate synthetase